MMVAFRVMTYFKVSLSTRNWDSAIKKPRDAGFFHIRCAQPTLQLFNFQIRST